MINAREKYRSNKPVIGDWVTFTYESIISRGQITNVMGNLCYVRYGDEESCPFIWCFKDGLNILHNWPTKEGLRNV